MRGKVKWFNPKKGYGFISAEDGTETFVHYTGINQEGFKTLKEGQAVTFDKEKSEKGDVAVHVKTYTPEV